MKVFLTCNRDGYNFDTLKLIPKITIIYTKRECFGKIHIFSQNTIILIYFMRF
jgi:hypothetical protein